MNPFFSELSRFGARWRIGLLLVAVLMTLALGALTLVALGVFDFMAPFSDKVRPTVFAAWCSVLALIALSALMPLLKLGRKGVAECADATLSARRPVTTALEVSQQNEQAGPEAGSLRSF